MNPEATATIPVDRDAWRRLLAVAVPVALATVLTDYLFWGGSYGVSVGVFFGALNLLMLTRLRQRPSWRLGAWLVMLAATCVQSGLAVSLSNVLAACGLTAAIAGEVFQPQLRGLWARVSEVLYGLLSAPARWVGVHRDSSRAFGTLRLADRDVTGGAATLAWVLLPAALLLLVFGGLFYSGHAIFHDFLIRADALVWTCWMALDLTPLRFGWWLCVATLALGIFHGTRAPAEPRRWTFPIPRIRRAEGSLAFLQTGFALIAVNVLFFSVNTLDALYLWGQSGLPVGVNRSAFVHEGVNSLIVAVVLSAVVIALVFQQEDRVSGSRWLRGLAQAWVLQNLLLIGGVLRRLQFYTADYELTEKRIYVVCFIALVAVGFLLLAGFVHRRPSFNWLLGRNALAIFALFFALQFADVAGWVAQYNVRRWEERRPLDLPYLAALGPTAWPQLIHVAETAKNPETATTARDLLKGIAAEYRPADWRAWQARLAAGLDEVRAFLAKP